MTWRMLKSVLVATGCWAVVTHLDDIARYLRLRDMSNPARYPAPDQPPRTPRG